MSREVHWKSSINGRSYCVPWASSALAGRGEAVLMSPPVTRARIVWLLLLRRAEAASEGAEAVRPKREVGTRDSVGGWVRVGG